MPGTSRILLHRPLIPKWLIACGWAALASPSFAQQPPPPLEIGIANGRVMDPESRLGRRLEARGGVTSAFELEGRSVPAPRAARWRAPPDRPRADAAPPVVPVRMAVM